MIDVVVLGTALAMDSMAVAAAAGAVGLGRGGAARLAGVFGFFHLAMASFGCGAGVVAEQWIGTWDHWVAFAVLVVLGVKMIHSAYAETRRSAASSNASIKAPSLAWTVLLALGFATSFDALAAGILLPTLAPPQLLSIAVITVIVGALTFVGFHAGARLGARSRYLQVAGGFAIIAVGCKTLLVHLV